MLNVQGIKKYLKSDFDITVFDSIESTNTYLKEKAKNGAAEGTVVIARSQSGGKGRLGRSFFSPDDTGIYMSLLLRPDSPPDTALSITACAAVCAAETIENLTGVHSEIKWVNDIYCHGRKVCGILTEGQINPDTSNLSFAILGIGINVFTPKGGFPDELSDIAGSILPNEKTDDILNKMTAEFLNIFSEKYHTLSDKSFLNEYKNRSCLLGKTVKVTNSDIIGTAVDIDDDFHLILKLSNGKIMSLSSGEVSVREILPKNLEQKQYKVLKKLF